MKDIAQYMRWDGITREKAQSILDGDTISINKDGARIQWHRSFVSKFISRLIHRNGESSVLYFDTSTGFLLRPFSEFI